MKVYTAGKIWHASKFQHLRDTLGYDVNARWIDLDDNNYIVKRRKDLLWQIFATLEIAISSCYIAKI